jgi:hypothetical protein
MDEQSKKMLDEILAKEPAALTDSDKAFLQARSSYLSEEQRSVYAEVLADQQEAAEEAQTSTEEETPKKAKKAKGE